MWLLYILVAIVLSTAVLIGQFLLRLHRHGTNLATAYKLRMQTRCSLMAAQSTNQEQQLYKGSEVSETIYQNALNAYNACLQTPLNRFPAWMLRKKPLKPQDLPQKKLNFMEEQK